MAVLISPQDLATKFAKAGAVTLHSPSVQYRRLDSLDTAACRKWAAELVLSVEDVDDLQVRAGVCKFLTLLVGENGFSGTDLARYSFEAVPFVPMFDGALVADHIREQFEGVGFDSAVLVLSAMVIYSLERRHTKLGASMVSQVIETKLPGTSHNGLALMYPSPVVADPDPNQRDEAPEKLSLYWQRTLGVVPIQQHPTVLGQSTANTHLEDARHALQPVTEVSVSVESLRGCPELAVTD